MNVNVLESPAAQATRPSRDQARGGTAVPLPVRPGRRLGGRTGPAARPSRRLEPAGPLRSPTLRPHACSAGSPAVDAPTTRVSSWRLTDRGIALVLVAGLVIVTAALAVISLTALRVTGDHYQSGPVLQVSQAAA